MINHRGLKIEKVSFGNVDSDALFGPLDQGVFDFYERNKTRYQYAFDIGANIGVHTILMARQGWKVTAFEPDPVTYQAMLKNCAQHGVYIASWCAAVSGYDGRAEFVRVLGNTTGSHLRGMKSPYGELETFGVKVMDAKNILGFADFAKVDAEGAEGDIVCCLDDQKCDMIVEVGDPENAKKIWDHLQNIGRTSWAQKNAWSKVTSLDDIPRHHTEGALFIGQEPPFK